MSEVRDLLQRLDDWDVFMGSFDGAVWRDLRTMLNRARKAAPRVEDARGRRVKLTRPWPHASASPISRRDSRG